MGFLKKTKLIFFMFFCFVKLVGQNKIVINKIDSLQFANSDKFYASDIKKYKEIFDKVNERIEEKIEASKKQKTSPLPKPVK